jgi:hypothetical protein
LDDREPDLLACKNVHSAFFGTPDLHAWLGAKRDPPGRHLRGDDESLLRDHRADGQQPRLRGFVLDATHTFDRKGPDGVIVPAETLALATAANLHCELPTVMSTEDVLRLVP